MQKQSVRVKLLINLTRAMNNQEVENFCTGISCIAWNHTFEQFCDICGFNSNHSYSQQKWEEFRELSKYLAKFDNELLTTLVRSGLKLPITYIPA
ncbi:hypothetical protein NIES4071_103820 (plasmid) [Calothrix sp. NIES-4071]|nr:hypothetical protein NIES4071_103820 [Calothrix sp. NIES-4071]BAZ64369.1 hypothetical protein NIES4105_101020 [Calothrix sp. NIES-4105]